MRIFNLMPRLAGTLLVALLTSCGPSIETSVEEFTNLYRQLAATLEVIEDEETAQAAIQPIEALAPRILAAGQTLSRATSNGTMEADLSMDVMMACGKEQQRVAQQLKRLGREKKIWAIIHPALEQTMLLQAMPPR